MEIPKLGDDIKMAKLPLIRKKKVKNLKPNTAEEVINTSRPKRKNLRVKTLINTKTNEKQKKETKGFILPENPKTKGNLTNTEPKHVPN